MTEQMSLSVALSVNLVQFTPTLTGGTFFTMEMADRIQVDIEGLRPYIEAFSQLERRPSIAQMVRVLIEEALEARGEPPNIPTPKSTTIHFLRLLAEGKQPSDEELAQLAQTLDLELKYLQEICDRALRNRSSS